ncbi:sugar phosphate isomerase/epimerase family protein [Sporomusa acidovorans]|uniref:Xylose isomerase-like TIM barrel domain-containing protein n=1 Tax=Sporomusa acidovorans (strain ATCC 49682 / DSM 3132 / Mol) TaxID=1123286 RepID=A0ABZ3IZ12_SPOA4|nr:TIM barrel protein [Sporomusa acidovorans]OZC17632.1 endonuclease 4 [Sporomusa acidovorans DSM 3132]SDE10064.1 Xylose isomerase-like TIM barrel [Sporomusa acidovorans]
MLQLVNISNYTTDNELFGNSPERLQAFLSRYNLDGLEMMFCSPWDAKFHKREWMQGCHLRFWPWWLDFWRGDQEVLLRQFGSQESINECYGGPTREAWLAIYRDNIRSAQQAGVKYLVLHVSHTRVSELFNWNFSATSREVIEATIEVVNALAPEIPQDITLLFENLWWPGLTLTDANLTAMLLEGVSHRNIGIMLDTGHLMNTNPDLTTEAEGVSYILNTIKNLGSYAQYVKGIHLNKSLSGKYVRSSQNVQNFKDNYDMEEVMNHVLKIDEHRPFTTSAAQRIIDFVRPEFLVHEFIYRNRAEWEQKLVRQQKVLTLRKMAI